MRSARPKPLHRLCGRPMVLHVLDALAELAVTRVVVVVGHRAEWVTKTVVEHAPPGMAIEFVEQVEQRGTGDAMSVALTGLPDDEDDDDGDVVVLPGDTPLLRPATLAALVRPTGPPTTAPPCSPPCSTTPRVRPGGAGPRRRGGADGRARRRHRRGARGRRGQHLDLLLPPLRAGPVAAPAEPGQLPGRVLPDRRGRACSTTPGYRVGSVVVERHDGGGRGQRPGPAGGGRGRAAGPDQRAVDAPGGHHGGPRAHLHGHRRRVEPDVVLFPGSSCRATASSGPEPSSGPTPIWSTPWWGGRGGHRDVGRRSASVRTPGSGPFAVPRRGPRSPPARWSGRASLEECRRRLDGATRER